MKDFLNSVKEDLVDPRLRVLVAVVLVAVVAAVAYAKLGGSSSTVTPTASAPAPAATAAAPPAAAAVPAANPNAAVAETTYGNGVQHHSKLTNPFTALPTAKPKTTTVTTPTGATKTAAAAPAAPSSPTTHTTTTSAPVVPATPVTPVTPATHIEYRVTVELGPAPATAGETPHLTVYKNVHVGQSLPSKSHPLVVLKGAGTNGKALLAGKPDTSTATFTLSGFNPPIVTGPGACLPTKTQCEAIELDSNVPEELQFAEPSGQTVMYLLKLTLVDAVKVAD
jgi:hypothetical protein